MSAGVFVGMYAILLPYPQSLLSHFCYLEATFDLPPDGCWLFFPGPFLSVCLLVFRSGSVRLPVMGTEASSRKESQVPAESPREITTASQHCQIPPGKPRLQPASASLLWGSQTSLQALFRVPPLIFDISLPAPVSQGLVCLGSRKLVAALGCNRHLLGPSASSTWSCSPRESVVGLDWQREASEHILRVPSFLNLPLISFFSFDPFSVASLRLEFQYIHPSPLEVSYLMELVQLASLWNSWQPSQWPHTSDFP